MKVMIGIFCLLAFVFACSDEKAKGPTSIPTPPSAERLLPIGSTPTDQLRADVIPGGSSEILIVGTQQQTSGCLDIFAKMFSFDITAQSWGLILDTDSWPSAEKAINYMAANGNRDSLRYCVQPDGRALDSLNASVVRMAADRDYLVLVASKSAGTAISQSSTIYIVGWIDNRPTLLFEDSRRGSIKAAVSGDSVRITYPLYSAADSSCCPSSQADQTLTLDKATGRVLPSSPTVIPVTR
jgi:hypothetical protein